LAVAIHTQVAAHNAGAGHREAVDAGRQVLEAIGSLFVGRGLGGKAGCAQDDARGWIAGDDAGDDAVAGG